MMDDVAALKEQNELLREEVALLKQRLGADADDAFILRSREVLGTTRSQTRLLKALLKSAIGSKASLLYAYAEGHDDPPDLGIVGTQVCYLRPKLRKFGVEIETVWGQGYRIAPEGKQRLSALLGI